MSIVAADLNAQWVEQWRCFYNGALGTYDPGQFSVMKKRVGGT
jgi:hypothetical protein